MEEDRILCERRAGARLAPGGGGAAIGRLLARLVLLGELARPLPSDAVALEPDARGRLCARLVAPHAFRFGSRSVRAAPLR